MPQAIARRGSGSACRSKPQCCSKRRDEIFVSSTQCARDTFGLKTRVFIKSPSRRAQCASIHGRAFQARCTGVSSRGEWASAVPACFFFLVTFFVRVLFLILKPFHCFGQVAADCSDSKAEPLFDETYWPELRVDSTAFSLPREREFPISRASRSPVLRDPARSAHECVRPVVGIYISKDPSRDHSQDPSGYSQRDKGFFHLPLQVVVLVASAAEKETPSTEGMQRSARSSRAPFP